MKKNLRGAISITIFLKLFITTGAILFCTVSFAQLPVYISGKLDGESIVHWDTFDWGGRMVATPTDIYSKSITKGTVVATLDTIYDLLWKAPEPNKIVEMYVKQTIYRDDSGKITVQHDSPYLIVVLSNGDVYKLFVDHYDDPYGGIGKAGGINITSEGFLGNALTEHSENVKDVEGDALFLLSTSHLYSSRDSTTWQIDSAGLNGAFVTAISQDTILRIYAATTNGLYIQDTATNSILQPDTFYKGPPNLVSVYVDRQNRQFVCTSGGDTYSSNDGKNWFIDTTGMGSIAVSFFKDDAYGNIYAVSGSKLYKSPGGNAPWQRIDYGINNITIAPAYISSLSGDSILCASTNYGPFISPDAGATWLLSYKGIHAENIYSMAKTNAGGVFLSDALGVYNSKNGGTSWNKVYPVNGFTGNVLLFNDGQNNIYALDRSTQGNLTLTGLLYKSTNGGLTWALDTAGLSKVGGTVFYVDEKGTQHIGNSFYDGSQPSSMWQKPLNGVWAIDTVGFPVLSYSFVEDITSGHDGYLYATGYFGNKMMRRSLTGTKWTIDTAGIPSSIFYFNKITGYNGDVLGTTNTALYHRGSGTWQNIPLPSQLSYPSVSAAVIDSGGIVFVALSTTAGTGVYYTGDFGANWNILPLLDSATVTSIKAYGDSVYILTSNQGAYVIVGNNALPVVLSSITAYPLGKGIQVEWNGYNETNMASYDVEKSADGIAFTKVGNVLAKGGAINKYNWFDASPFEGDNFYRVKAIGKNNSYQYSGIVKVNIHNTTSGIAVYPNPTVGGNLNIQLNNIATGKYTLMVYSSSGQIIYGRVISHPGGSASVNVSSATIARGVYWVVLKGVKNTYNKIIVVE